MMRTPLPLRAGVPGAISARKAVLGDREVVLARCDPSIRRGAFNPADGHTLADAAFHALEARLPLVVTIASSGADVTEGLAASFGWGLARSEEHTSELQSPYDLVCRLLLEKKKTRRKNILEGYRHQQHVSHRSFDYLSLGVHAK